MDPLYGGIQEEAPPVTAPPQSPGHWPAKYKDRTGGITPQPGSSCARNPLGLGCLHEDELKATRLIDGAYDAENGHVAPQTDCATNPQGLGCHTGIYEGTPIVDLLLGDPRPALKTLDDAKNGVINMLDSLRGQVPQPTKPVRPQDQSRVRSQIDALVDDVDTDRTRSIEAVQDSLRSDELGRRVSAMNDTAAHVELAVSAEAAAALNASVQRSVDRALTRANPLQSARPAAQGTITPVATSATASPPLVISPSQPVQKPATAGDPCPFRSELGCSR